MKYMWNGINTALIFMCFMFVFVSKDINTQAYDECKRLEEKIVLQEKLIDNLTEIATQKDTIVVNVKNYNYYRK